MLPEAPCALVNFLIRGLRQACGEFLGIRPTSAFKVGRMALGNKIAPRKMRGTFFMDVA
jgi:hypothetical protein